MFWFLKWAGYKVLRKHTVYGMENVKEEKGSVFVCNHDGIYGPVAITLFFPYLFRPWVIHNMTVKGLCRRYLASEFIESMPAWFRPFFKVIVFPLEPVCLWLMGKVSAIPVYLGNMRIFETFRISADVLARGGNIVIFPERRNDPYTEFVKNFRSGFVHLARMHWKDTGNQLHFYPVYSDKKRRTITIGKPVVYDPEADFKYERERITKALMDGMHLCAQNSKEDLVAANVR